MRPPGRNGVMGSKINYVNEEKTVHPNKMKVNKCDFNRGISVMADQCDHSPRAPRNIATPLCICMPTYELCICMYVTLA